MKTKIDKSATLKEILAIEGSEEVLAKHGVPCVSCPMAKFELDKLELEDICKMYQLPLKEILQDLNKL